MGHSSIDVTHSHYIHCQSALARYHLQQPILAALRKVYFVVKSRLFCAAIWPLFDQILYSRQTYPSASYCRLFQIAPALHVVRHVDQTELQPGSGMTDGAHKIASHLFV